MRLLKYGACAGEPFRRLIVEDAGELEIGIHPKIEAFGCMFTNVNVGRVSDSLVEFDIPQASDWSVVMADSFLLPEYRERIGDHTPRIEMMLDAHIIKGKLPTLVQDFDAFVEELRAKVATTGLPNIEFMHDRINQTDKGYSFDLWMLYKYNLMLDGKMNVTRSKAEELIFQDNHISEKGTEWWLREHNKQLMELARTHDMLAAFITFGVSNRNDREFFYTFVMSDGSQTQRPVDASEFMHLSVHGKFPDVAIVDNEGGYNFDCNFIHHFPKAYHDLQDATNITIGHNYALNLLRFI